MDLFFSNESRKTILRIVNRLTTFQVVSYFFDLENRRTGNDSESRITQVRLG